MPKIIAGSYFRCDLKISGPLLLTLEWFSEFSLLGRCLRFLNAGIFRWDHGGLGEVVCLFHTLYQEETHDRKWDNRQRGLDNCLIPFLWKLIEHTIFIERLYLQIGNSPWLQSKGNAQSSAQHAFEKSPIPRKKPGFIAEGTDHPHYNHLIDGIGNTGED